MTDRDALYLTALLQDLGVLVGRARLPEWESRAAGFRSPGLPPERALSAALLSEYATRKQFLPSPRDFPSLWAPPAEQSGAPGLVPVGVASIPARLLRIAEACAEPEATPGSGASGENSSRIRLESPFSRIAVDRAGESLRLPQPFHLGLEPLSIRREALFPAERAASSPDNPYQRVVSALLAELESIVDEAGLFALLEKYLYSVPLGADLPDVSLFDRSRATAAIALCLHDEWTHGAWRGEETRILGADPTELPAPCLLVSGGLSGIQDFIFDVPSRRASKSLKGRSYFVQLAADGCVRYLLDTLDLKEASLLYSGGGNFFLLVPACRAPALEDARRKVAMALLPESLSLALGWVPVGIADFVQGRFAACWKAAREQVEQRKGRRFQELGVSIFKPFPQGPRDEEGREDAFADLTQRLSRSTAYSLVRGGESTETAEGRLLARLGLTVQFTPADADPRATAFNETDFAGRFRNYRFAVKDLPRFTEHLIRKLYPDGNVPREEVAPKNLVDFNHLARLAELRTGTHKLGVLKMDVDDLGQIFFRGLPERQRGIARIAALSRTMRWFFEAYINTLLQEGSFTWRSADPAPREERFGQQLYPVFSGGDDFLLVGAWDAVFEFALRVRSEFAAFVGGHPGITLSASLLVLDPQASISRFAAEADARLEDAKEARVGKDCVSVFDQVLTWDELDEAARLKARLEVLVKQRGESRAIVQRVQQSATGYRRLRDAAVRGHFHPERIWRLAYFLARNARKDNLEEVKSLSETHQRLLLDAFIKPASARNPALFTVAGRWAELATRDVKPADDDRRALSSR